MKMRFLRKKNILASQDRNLPRGGFISTGSGSSDMALRPDLLKARTRNLCWEPGGNPDITQL